MQTHRIPTTYTLLQDDTQGEPGRLLGATPATVPERALSTTLGNEAITTLEDEATQTDWMGDLSGGLGSDPAATVIAERVGWTGSITWFGDNVRRVRPEHRPVDPADGLTWLPGEIRPVDRLDAEQRLLRRPRGDRPVALIRRGGGWVRASGSFTVCTGQAAHRFVVGDEPDGSEPSTWSSKRRARRVLP